MFRVIVVLVLSVSPLPCNYSGVTNGNRLPGCTRRSVRTRPARDPLVRHWSRAAPASVWINSFILIHFYRKQKHYKLIEVNLFFSLSHFSLLGHCVVLSVSFRCSSVTVRRFKSVIGARDRLHQKWLTVPFFRRRHVDLFIYKNNPKKSHNNMQEKSIILNFAPTVCLVTWDKQQVRCLMMTKMIKDD